MLSSSHYSGTTAMSSKALKQIIEMMFGNTYASYLFFTNAHLRKIAKGLKENLGQGYVW